MKVGVVTFARDNNVPHAGSTRIRVTWPLKYWHEAEEFEIGRRYDVLVFQKAYWLEYTARFRGVRILDLCDPDFLHDGGRCRLMMDACDAITCSSPALTDHVAGLTRTPVRYIPDRLDLDAVAEPVKQHAGDTQTVAWYGYSHNYEMLDTAIPALLRLGVRRLVVIADEGRRYTLPPEACGRIELTTRTWAAASVCADLLEADVVLNPRAEHGVWRFKSNNKSILAWALGLPVAHDEAELARLMTADERRAEADRRRAEVLATCDVRRSVEEYRALIDELMSSRKERVR
jgi:hypothetical protein